MVHINRAVHGEQLTDEGVTAVRATAAASVRCTGVSPRLRQSTTRRTRDACLPLQRGWRAGGRRSHCAGTWHCGDRADRREIKNGRCLPQTGAPAQHSFGTKYMRGKQNIQNNAIITQEQAAIETLKVLANIVRSLRNEVFKDGLDFGKIPGTGDKPTLLLPGMEKLLRALHLRAEYVEKSRIEDFEANLIYYRYECRLIDYETGMCISTAIGSANSMESKWRWRDQKRKCPVCGKEAIIKGKEEYGGGWLCFKKQEGCGAKFMDGDTSIESQVVGRIENPDIFDQMNTIDKIAQKRALSSAIKGAANVSEFFTVDLEDFQTYETRPFGETGFARENVIEGTFTEVSSEQPSSVVRGAGLPQAPAQKPPVYWTDDETKFTAFYASALERFSMTQTTVDEVLERFAGLGLADWRETRGWALAALVADYCENSLGRIDNVTAGMGNGDEKASFELRERARQIANRVLNAEFEAI